MKLPKQWRHWCKISGLKPVSRPRKAWSWHTLEGCGYLWRVNCLHQFQVSLPYHDFDRWANSTACSLPLPQNKDQFMAAYFILWSQARKSEVE